MRKVNIPLDKLNMKIKEKYPNTKQIIKLKVGGQNNEGIFRLCTNTIKETKINIILNKLKRLASILGEKKEILENILTSQLSKKKLTRGNLNQLKGLISANIINLDIEAIEKKMISSRLNTNTLNKIKTLPDIINIIENKKELPQNWVSDIENILNLTDLNLRDIFKDDLYKWGDEAKDILCTQLLKIKSDEISLGKEQLSQLRVFQISDPTNLITYRPGEVKTLENAGDGGINLFSFTMKYSQGKELCYKCPQGIFSLESKEQQDRNNEYKEKFSGFNIDYTNDLLEKLEFLYNNNIIHGDLNLENIMLNKDKKTIILIDWGESEDISQKEKNIRKHLVFNDIKSLITNIKNLLENIERYAPNGVTKISQMATIENLINRLKSLQSKYYNDPYSINESGSYMAFGGRDKKLKKTNKRKTKNKKKKNRRQSQKKKHRRKSRH